jgi:hypothetical protein
MYKYLWAFLNILIFLKVHYPDRAGFNHYAALSTKQIATIQYNNFSSLKKCYLSIQL